MMMEDRFFYRNIRYKRLAEDTDDESYLSESTSEPDIVSFYDAEEPVLITENLNSPTSSDVKTSIKLSDIERLVIKRTLRDGEQHKKIIINNLVKELEDALNIFDKEYEEMSSAEKKVIEIEKNYGMRILGEVISYVCYKDFDKPEYLVGICKSLLRYDLEEVLPWGITLLPGLLNHRHERVKEYAIQLIDNWESTELLPILKNLQVSAKWMADYVDDVVENLERENVLYSKAV